MSTDDSGASWTIFFVASRPSMPGMRTSITTTSGRRRLVISTAPAPSDASPTTRMRGDRDSDSRSPSRTTSWSSTIRQVISRSSAASAKLGRFYARGSDGQRQLLRLRSRRDPHYPAVGDVVLAPELGDALAHGGRLGPLEIRPAGIELLVDREQLRPVVRQRGEKVLARPRPQEEDVAPDVCRPRVAG